MRRFLTHALITSVACLLIAAAPRFSVGGAGAAEEDSVRISGSLQKWHPMTLTLDGPAADESPSTFRNFRFQVTFTHVSSGLQRTVPGYFAADGDAANTSATSGATWRVRYTPGRAGAWTYTIGFRTGKDVTVSTDPTAGTANEFNGISGRFVIDQSRAQSPDVRALGFLEYAGSSYYRYADGTRYLGIGMDSPETFLEYTGFDGTANLGGASYVRDWRAHVPDWDAGDPTWAGGTAGAMKGKGLIGAINYIAERGINQQYFITMNVQGDGRGAYPYTPTAASAGAYDVFDVSKLAQWQVALAHMMKRGVTAHILLQETENELLFEEGDTSAVGNLDRRLYYREMIARLGWHPALIWNLGEEQNHTVNAPYGKAATTRQRRSWASYIRSTDPYDHPITIHNWQWDPDEYEEVYAGFLGKEYFEGPSLQWDESMDAEIRRWHDASAAAGRPWVVMMTEYNGGGQGANDSARAVWRKAALWEPLMNRAGAVELYFGNAGGVDVTTDDLRPWADALEQMRYARSFFDGLPLTELTISDPAAAEAGATYALVGEGDVFVFYWEEASDVGRLDLEGTYGTYTAEWFNPRTGEAVSADPISAGGVVELPSPPGNHTRDWALRLRRR